MALKMKNQHYKGFTVFLNYKKKACPYKNGK